MLQTWVYMMVDKGFFTVDGVEYAIALGETDIQLFNSYNEACRIMNFRCEGYYNKGYKLEDSDYCAEDRDLAFWKRLEDEGGHAHVFEIHRKVVYGDLFTVGQS